MVACWVKSPGRLANERGVAIGVVLLILVLVLLLGVTLIAVSVTENQAGSTVANMKKAFSAAESGFQEAMYRMRLDPATLTDEADSVCSAAADPVVIGQQGTPTTSWADPTSANFWEYNPPACSWTYAGSSATGYGNYLGGTAANLDSAGRTFTSSGAAHAAGGLLASANLTNTAADPRSYTVTVAPVVGFVGSCWQYVNQFGVPLGSCSSVAPNPLFKVISTGTAKNAQKKVSSMLQRFSVGPKLDGALTANSNVNVQAASTRIDGHNFDCNGNNPSDTDSVKAVTVPSSASLSPNKDDNLQCAAGTGSANCGGTSSAFPNTLGALLLGPSATTTEINALNDYLESIKIAPANAPTAAFHGNLYVTGNYAQPPDGSTGVLIVHNASNNAVLGNFTGGTFKGLIIADQINKIAGNAQIIGGVFAYGSAATAQVDSTSNIKYSKCIIAGLSKYFPFRNVSGTWHEQ